MRIKQDKLQQSLAKGQHKVFIVSGKEPLLVQECCDLIRIYCRDQDYSERLVFHAAKPFEWSVLDEHSQSFSLFGEKKLIEIRLEALPVDAGKKRLQAWAENPPEDCCLLLVSDKIESSTLNTKWFKGIESKSLHIQIWPVNLPQLPAWITKRLQQAGYKPTITAVTALCDHVEGNLLAAQQEIEKLQLLVAPGQLEATDVLTGISFSNKYSVFNLIDACLENKPKQVIKILQSLEAEGFEPSIVLWSLSREIRLLAKLYRNKRAGDSVDSCLQKERVFKNKWQTYKRYLGQNRPTSLPQAHHYCQLSDKAIKGVETQSCWRLLTQASLVLAGVNPLSASV